MNTVPFGKASWIGTIGAAAAVLVPFIPQLADATRDLGIPGQTWVWAAALLAGLVVIGRMWQAVMQTIYGESAAPADTSQPAGPMVEEFYTGDGQA